jgi:hypothetical protein
MAPTELFTGNSIAISFDAEVPCLVFTSGWLTLNDDRLINASRALVEKAEELCERYAELGLLADARGVTLLSYEDIEWSALNLMPRLVRVGISKVAIVYGENPTALARAVEFLALASITSLPIESKIFQNIGEAKAWLKEKLY